MCLCWLFVVGLCLSKFLGDCGVRCLGSSRGPSGRTSSLNLPCTKNVWHWAGMLAFLQQCYGQGVCEWCEWMFRCAPRNEPTGSRMYETWLEPNKVILKMFSSITFNYCSKNMIPLKVTPRSNKKWTQGTCPRVTLTCGWHRCLGYYSCIYAAGLAPDLQILPGGDQVGSCAAGWFWWDNDEMHQKMLLCSRRSTLACLLRNFGCLRSL